MTMPSELAQQFHDEELTQDPGAYAELAWRLLRSMSVQDGPLPPVLNKTCGIMAEMAQLERDGKGLQGVDGFGWRAGCLGDIDNAILTWLPQHNTATAAILLRAMRDYMFALCHKVWNKAIDQHIVCDVFYAAYEHFTIVNGEESAAVRIQYMMGQSGLNNRAMRNCDNLYAI